MEFCHTSNDDNLTPWLLTWFLFMCPIFLWTILRLIAGNFTEFVSKKLFLVNCLPEIDQWEEFEQESLQFMNFIAHSLLNIY